MDLFGIFVLLHIVCVVVWVGGGFTLLVAAETMRINRGTHGMMAVIDAVALLGPRLFVPVSALTVVFGALAAWFGPGFSELWVILGLVGFAATFLNGLLLIKPRAEKMAAMIAKEGENSPSLIPVAANLIMIARFDYVMLALVIVDMVLKPTTDDIWGLTAMAAVLVIGAALVFRSAARGQPATV